MRRALVIDDSRAMRAILRKYLRSLYFEVEEAGNGLEALARLRELGPVDLVLVDWNMPGMDGLEFTRSLRATPEYQDVRVMMVTSETDVSRMVLALEAGVDEYVMKPFTRGVISEKVGLLGFGAAA